MLTYIVGFAASALLFVFSDKVVKTQRWMPVVLALLIPCCIAGFRADTVGTDVQTYLVQMTNAAISSDSLEGYMNSNWFMIYRYMYVSDYEIGFSMLVYVAAKIFKSIYAVQFAIQAFTIVPVYIACTKMKSRFPVWLCMLTYYCMIFNTSLNLMRQAIGMAFIFLGYVYFTNREIKKCVFVTILAVLFHTSALLGIVIYLLHIFIKTDFVQKLSHGKTKSNYYMNMFIAILAGVLVVVGSNALSGLLSSLGLGRYAGYISGDLQFMPNQLISRLPVFVLFFYAWARSKKSNPDMRFFFVMLCFDFLCSQFSSVNSFGGRIALYFSQFQMLTYPTIYIETKKNKVVLFLLAAYMIFYWWFYFVYSGANATVPYVLGL